jgi:hypothetical protein
LLFSGSGKIGSRSEEEQQLFGAAHHVQMFNPAPFSREMLLETLPMEITKHIIITGELDNGIFHLIRPLRSKSLPQVQRILTLQ